MTKTTGVAHRTWSQPGTALNWVARCCLQHSLCPGAATALTLRQEASQQWSYDRAHQRADEHDANCQAALVWPVDVRNGANAGTTVCTHWSRQQHTTGQQQKQLIQLTNREQPHRMCLWSQSNERARCMLSAASIPRRAEAELVGFNQSHPPHQGPNVLLLHTCTSQLDTGSLRWDPGEPSGQRSLEAAPAVYCVLPLTCSSLQCPKRQQHLDGGGEDAPHSAEQKSRQWVGANMEGTAGGRAFSCTAGLMPR